MQFNVVVVDMWDKDWAMILRSSSLMFWLWAACTFYIVYIQYSYIQHSLYIGFCLRAGGRTVSCNMERIRR